MAFDPETPGHVVQFVLISEAKETIDALLEVDTRHRGKTFEQLALDDQFELLKIVAKKHDATPNQLAEVKQMLTLLPELTKVVTSDKRSHSSVPYGSRRYLPQELQGLTFQVMKEFDFAGDGKILAIGGTDKEINLLSTEPYNLVKENICAINVLPYENPHYLADMTLADHMEILLINKTINNSALVLCETKV